MREFDPLVDIKGCAEVCDSDGSLPSFHDAFVYTLNIWHGDLRPEDNIWLGPQITASFGLFGRQASYSIEVIKLKFLDCDAIELLGFTYGGAMLYNLDFSFEDRGFYADGCTPLPPYILVTFSNSPGVKPLLKFKCFSVVAISREVQHAPPYA